MVWSVVGEPVTTALGVLVGGLLVPLAVVGLLLVGLVVLVSIPPRASAHPGS